VNHLLGKTGVVQEKGSAWKLFYVLTAAVGVFLCIFFATADFERVLSVVPDDAAYYFGIAENVAKGVGESFDGINATNGYQPLWLYVLAAVFRIHTGTPEAMYRAALVFQTVMLAVAAVMLYRWFIRFHSGRAALPAAILFLVFVAVPSVNGMESSLLILLLVILAVLGWKMRIDAESGFLKNLLFGVVTGFVVLARLDMIFLPAVVCLLCLWPAVARGVNRIPYFLKSLAIGAGTTMVVAPYLIRNHVKYGDIMPISGALKSSFPSLVLSGYIFSRMGFRDKVALLVVVAYLVWELVRALRGDDEVASNRNLMEGGLGGSARENAGASGPGYFRIAAMVLSATVVLHFLHSVLFMKWAVFRWHFVPYSFVAVVVLCEVMERLLKWKWLGRRMFYRSIIVFLIAMGFFSVWRRYGDGLHGGWIIASYRAARWARGNTDKDAIFAMKDAGVFGYFSRRSTISLDGVVNNLEYQEALRRRGLKRYLAGKNVEYLVQHAFWRRNDIVDGTYEVFHATYLSRLYGVESDTLSLRKEWEVYRSDPYYDGPYRTVFIVWKLDWE